MVCCRIVASAPCWRGRLDWDHAGGAAETLSRVFEVGWDVSGVRAAGTLLSSACRGLAQGGESRNARHEVNV